jgi:2-C-methyl-D-erythritol 4-phosphate cytidylyltransferase
VIPVAETLALRKGDQLVAIPTGDGAVLVQTPCAFHAAVLQEAYADSPDARDEAALLVRRVVHAVSGDWRNIHIVRPDDLEVARLLLEAPNRSLP